MAGDFSRIEWVCRDGASRVVDLSHKYIARTLVSWWHWLAIVLALTVRNLLVHVWVRCAGHWLIGVLSKMNLLLLMRTRLFGHLISTSHALRRILRCIAMVLLHLCCVEAGRLILIVACWRAWTPIRI